MCQGGCRIEVAGLAGTDDVAPLALTVIDKIDTDRYVLGDAPVRFDRDDPEAWAEAAGTSNRACFPKNSI